MKSQICTKCGEEKPFSEFYFRKDNNCYRKECKKCFAEATKEFKYNKVPWRKHFYAARRRCENSKNKDYKWYGGKGIKFELTEIDVKEMWFRDKAYKMKYPTIDREDADKNYCLENCRFIEFKNNLLRMNRLPTYKPVLQFDIDGNFIQEYCSLKDAKNKTGICATSISNVAKGKRHYNTAGGFIWRFKNVKN